MEIEKSNWKLAQDKMEAADKAGRLWCQGDGVDNEGAMDELKKEFIKDDQIYNVVFVRNKKDKRGGEMTTMVAVNEERNTGTIMVLNFCNERNT